MPTSTAQTSLFDTAISHDIFLESGNDGKITHISVYPSRADITRLFKFQLNVGENRVVISGLPQVLDDNSIRVEVSGAALLQDVMISQGDQDVSAKDDSEVLAEEIERKDIQIKRKEKTVDALLFSLSSVNVCSSTPSDVRSTIKNIDEVATELGEDLATLKRELRKLQPRTTGTNTFGIVQLSRHLKTASFVIFGESEHEVELSLHYAVSQAGWTPVYDLRVDTETKDNSIQLLYKASISQRTGEDWRNVQLTLETSLPEANAKLPYLSPWKLSFYTGGHTVRLGVNPEEFTDSWATLSAYNPAAMVNLSNRGDPNAMATFEVTEPKTIYGNGAVHKVALAELELDAEIEWVSIPTLGNVRMYWTAAVRNKSDYPLLKGLATVYINGSFTARSEIPYVSPQDRFTCALGVDPTIRAIYHPRDKKRSQSGFYTKSNNHIFEQRITVINTKSCAVENVKVIDHIPISEDSKISVKLLFPALPVSEPGSEKVVDMSESVQVSKGVLAQWERGDDTDGGVETLGSDGRISWKCNIPAQGRVSLVFSWEVSAPADKVVSGL